MGFKDAWRKASNRIKGGVGERVMSKHILGIIDKINQNSPTVREPNDPYEMNRKVEAENGGVKQGSDGSVAAVIRIDLNRFPAARAIEFGSGLHDPKNPRYLGFGTRASGPEDGMLRFQWAKIGGQWFIGPWVNHPGRPAKPYIKPSIEETSNALYNLLGKFMDEEIRVSFTEERTVLND